MTRDAVLTAWLEGARIGTLARVINEDPAGVEDALRLELRTIREEYQPSVSADPPLTTAKKAQATASSPSPAPKKTKRPLVHAAEMRKSPVRRAVEKAVNPLEHAEFPEPLRHPLAIKQRALYLMLKTGPKDVAELVALAEAAGVQESDIYKWVSNGLYGMQQKDVVIKPESPGGKWRLA